MDLLDIRDRLVARLAALDSEVERLEAERREPLDDDFEEQAVALEGLEASSALEQAALAETAQIKAALGRLEAGTYGRCAICDDSISEARLNALPTATRCIVCAT